MEKHRYYSCYCFFRIYIDFMNKINELFTVYICLANGPLYFNHVNFYVVLQYTISIDNYVFNISLDPGLS
jgi:hypothetical protein